MYKIQYYKNGEWHLFTACHSNDVLWFMAHCKELRNPQWVRALKNVMY